MAEPVRGRLSVGTSGWSYRHWRGDFYPAGLGAAGQFAVYSSRFMSVELNATFYRLPAPAMVERWRDQAPPGFSYAVKASRFITHLKRLADPERSLERFAAVLDQLGDRLAVVLLQLPPRWRFDGPRLDAFLGAFRRRCGARRIACEFRDPSWYGEECLAILRRHGAGFCIYHLAGHQSPVHLTSDFAYLRLHGDGGRYHGEYGATALAPWADQVRAWRSAGHDVFCYFDNDIGGAAPRDAATLGRMLAEG